MAADIPEKAVEAYVVHLPISPDMADVAGAPAEWIARMVRAVGHPMNALTEPALAHLPLGDGWRLVPVEPTQKMFMRAQQHQAAAGYEIDCADRLADTWKNMLAAAPLPPSPSSAITDQEAR